MQPVSSDPLISGNSGFNLLLLAVLMSAKFLGSAKFMGSQTYYAFKVTGNSKI